MEIFVVYNNPSDFPGMYVLRRWVGDKADPEPIMVGTLEEVRRSVPDGKVMLSRCPDDDPCILETWI